MTDKLVRLDLSRFTARDIRKVGELGDKMRLLHRWFRSERVDGADGQAFKVYSGDRGPRQYASYQFSRRDDGTYRLIEGDSGEELARSRTIDGVIDALPSDFYYPER